jgi:hypothetical protein
MITVNLREIFTVDSQADLAAKLNFNFNQLLALGFGQTGPIGPIGPSGPAGPIGPIGETGAAGSQIFSGSIDPTSSDPIDAVIGDYYISSNKIHKKLSNASGSEWDVVTNFNTIFGQIASVGTSTWQLGAVTGLPISTSRYLTPIKSYGNTDRVSIAGTSGEYLLNDPNWFNESGDTTNSQVTLYNFDPYTTKIYDPTTPGQNSYGISIMPVKQGAFGTSGGEGTFPYSSLLSLYSFYSPGASTTEATQFDAINGSATGNRHQLELGSVDTIPESLVSADPLDNNVVSPTWQNLRIRKYRIQADSNIGGAVIHADFNLNSGDTSNDPSLTSKFTWRINKKPNTTLGSGKIIEMSLSNQTAESQNLSKLTGLGVDGLHLKFGATDKFAIGFDPANNSTTIKNLLIDGGGTLDSAVFRNMGVRIVTTGSAAGTSTFSLNGIASSRSVIIETTASQGNVIVRSGSAGRSVFILSSPTTQGSVFIGTSTDQSIITSDFWTPSSGYAIKTRGNRLAAGIPFPDGTSAAPRASSSDKNVLDEYLEVSFTPIVSFDETFPYSAPNSSITANLGEGPTFGDANGRFIKIGKLVHFDVTFSISSWRAKKPLPTGISRAGVAPGSLSRYTSLLDYGNVSTSTTNPFSGLLVGGEPNGIRVRGLPNHYPALFNLVSATNFSVNISTDEAGSPGLRGNPFYYSWGGTGTSGTTGTMSTFGANARLWLALEPASVHGRLTRYTASGNSLPQIELFGYRRVPYSGTGSVVGFTATSQFPTEALAPVQSKVTIWDFLSPWRQDTTKVFVTISGSYITDHQTFQQANPNDTLLGPVENVDIIDVGTGPLG